MRLLVPACLAWIAALVAVGLQASTVIWAASITVAAALTVWCVVTRRGGWAVLVAISLAVAAFVGLSASIIAEQRRPSVLIDAADSDSNVSVIATIDGLAHANALGSDRLRVTATITQIAGEAVRVPATLFGPSMSGTSAIGSSVEVKGRVLLTAASDASSALVFADDPMSVVEPAPWYLSWAHDMRQGFVELCSELPGAGGQLLPGLAVGDTSAVTPELDTAMKTSSLSHLTAVSGDTVIDYMSRSVIRQS